MDVTVYAQLRSATDQKQVSVAFEGGTVRDALEAFVEAYPRAEPHLFTDAGAPESSARVAVDGEVVALDDPCPADAEISIHPAMQGG